MSLTTDLLSHGYFPKQLPPAFTSRMWGETVLANSIEPPNKYPEAELILHSIVRQESVPRILSVPHPCHFHILAKLIGDNFGSLMAICNKSTISLTTPRLGDTAKGERALEPRDGWPNKSRMALERRRGKKVMLRADISQCYPSMYTHAISWAIQGKPAAQLAARTRLSSVHFADNIDKAIRDAQEKQSVGIPIGPDTSFILAEVVLSAVDVELKKRISRLTAIRITDDYEFYFDNVSEAESAKVALSHSLAQFKMVLNPKKTKVVDLPLPLEPEWKHVLSSYAFNGRYNEAVRRLRAATDLAFSQRKDDSGTRAITYLLAMLAPCKFSERIWPTVQSIALASMEFEENSLPRAAKLLLNATARTWRIDKAAIKDVVNRIIARYSPLLCGHIVAWSIWLLTKLNIQLPRSTARLAEQMNDPIVLLTLAHARSKGCAIGFNINQFVRSNYTKASLHTSLWIFYYEAVQQGWLGAATHKIVEADLKKDPYLAPLNKRNVSFYSQDAGNIVITPKPHIQLSGNEAHAWARIVTVNDYE